MRRRGRETLESRVERERDGNRESEIIIIIAVVFQGQYLRFSTTVSLKHNPPHLPVSTSSLHHCLRAKLLSSLPLLSHCNAFSLSLIRQRKAASHPPGHCLERAKDMADSCRLAFQTQDELNGR